jgi:hypothetical protein
VALSRSARVGEVVVHDAQVALEGERELAAAAALLLRRASADSEQLGILVLVKQGIERELAAVLCCCDVPRPPRSN